MNHLLFEGIVLTVIGMGVVYASLVVLMVVVQLLNRAFDGGAETPASREGAPAGGEDLAPVLAAAAGWFLETEGPEVYVPEVERPAGSHWARRARQSPAWSRRPR